MALGNAFGAAHFLQQDRWLDGDESATPAGARLSDVSFLRFVREYSGLFPHGSVFWRHLERYIEEYHASLDWEARVLSTDAGRKAVEDGQLADTLLKLGRKMSPLKATAAGIALLAGRLDTLARLERMVEDYHAAYQLVDDVEDLSEDLESGRWSAAAWFLSVRSGLAPPAEAGGGAELLRLAACSGALDELVTLVCSRYERAADGATRLGATILESYLLGSARRTRLVLGRTSGRLSVAARARTTARGSRVGGGAAAIGEPGRTRGGTAGLHDFRVGGDAFVYDTRSGLFFEADPLAADVIEWLRAGASEAAYDVLRMNHGSGPVGEALGEIAALSGRATGASVLDLAPGDGPESRGEGPSLHGLSSVALNVAGGCNLACDYCYLGREPATGLLMSDEVARGAVNLLMNESFGEQRVSVVFFGGEPLLNPGVIRRTAEYVREAAAAREVEVSLHLTTNGTLLTPGVAEMLRTNGVRVLVSIDGPASSHDAHRPFPDGSGSYRAIAENLRRLPPGLRRGARATVTEGSPPLTDIVSHLSDLGFGVVHLAPVSDGPMSREFAGRLVRELDDLAFAELEALRAGRAPRAGCFIEPVLALELGRQRLAPCGAGARYVSVDHDGRLFLCHRFAGDPGYAVGSVAGGLDRFAVGRLLDEAAARSDACSRCWAHGLCGGPCVFDLASAGGAFDGPSGQRCRVTRRTLELSMWLYASLPDESRARLRGAARSSARPELDGPGGGGSVDVAESEEGR
jgi:uncharacterized protein